MGNRIKYFMVFIGLILGASAFSQGMSDASLYQMLIAEGIQHPKVVLAQAKLETGNYTSLLCKNKHNLFGIKGKRGYRTFSTYTECIRYYKDHIQNRYDGHSDYYVFLKRIGYASDPKYVTKLKSIVKKLTL